MCHVKQNYFCLILLWSGCPEVLCYEWVWGESPQWWLTNHHQGKRLSVTPGSQIAGCSHSYTFGVLISRTRFYIKWPCYFIQIKRLPFGFMKSSNNTQVGLEIETLIGFPQSVSDTAFTLKLCFYDSYWEGELFLFFTCGLHYTQCSLDLFFLSKYPTSRGK